MSMQSPKTRRHIQNMINGAKSAGNATSVREMDIRKISDALIMPQSTVERMIDRLRKLGFYVVPEDPTPAMCQALGAPLCRPHMLKEAIKAGAL